MSRGGINKVILIGNLGADPEVKYTPDGTAVANFNLATTESWTNRTSGERQERTEWHNVVLWGKRAKPSGQYLKKGSRIYVEGKLQTRSWEDQSGQKRYMTEVVVDDMQMLDSRGDTGGGGRMQADSRGDAGGFGGGGTQASDSGPAAAADYSPPANQEEDDLPF